MPINFGKLREMGKFLKDLIHHKDFRIVECHKYAMLPK
jgi:hypothetical protein